MSQSVASFYTKNRCADMKVEVVKFLFKIGLFANLKGFDYILSAVGEVVEDPSCLHSVTKSLYPKIAKNFNTTVCGVERNIRNAIEVAYNKGKFFEVANTYYGGNFSKYEKPTNSEFIAFIMSIIFLTNT